jgi:hypothetical protein
MSNVRLGICLFVCVVVCRLAWHVAGAIIESASHSRAAAVLRGE